MNKIKHLLAFLITVISIVSCEKNSNEVVKITIVPKTDTVSELGNGVPHIFIPYTDTFYGPATEEGDCNPWSTIPSYIYAFYPSPNEVIFTSSYYNMTPYQYNSPIQGDFLVTTSNTYSDEIMFGHHVKAAYTFMTTNDSLYYGGQQNYGCDEYLISFAGKRISKRH
jgi:hypothetical protein